MRRYHSWKRERSVISCRNCGEIRDPRGHNHNTNCMKQVTIIGREDESEQKKFDQGSSHNED